MKTLLYIIHSEFEYILFFMLLIAYTATLQSFGSDIDAIISDNNGHNKISRQSSTHWYQKHPWLLTFWHLTWLVCQFIIVHNSIINAVNVQCMHITAKYCTVLHSGQKEIYKMFYSLFVNSNVASHFNTFPHNLDVS